MITNVRSNNLHRHGCPPYPAKDHPTGHCAQAFEEVAAALISELLDVGIAMAKGGFQHGGDAGSAGRQGRRFRIETKRYADGTEISNREILGEIDHALTRDRAIEGWFFAATRKASEQLEQDLLGKSDVLGLPVVVIDWKPDTFPAMAALCTCAPDVLDTLVNTEAGDLARGLAGEGASALARLKREMEIWNLGFERLRTLSHDYLDAAWMDPRTAQAVLGQNLGPVRRVCSSTGLLCGVAFQAKGSSTCHCHYTGGADPIPAGTGL